VGYRCSKGYKPQEHTDPTSLIFHESLADVVYANEAYGNGSIVILTTKRLLKLFLYSTGVHIDGTFKITPSIFYNPILKGQVLGGHVIYGGASHIYYMRIYFIKDKSDNTYIYYKHINNYL
jgi:hypothetical protein